MCINESCKTLHANGKSLTAACFLAKKQNRCRLNDQFGATPNVLDIEDLQSLGKNSNVCPYYGGLNQAKTAQVILIPSSTLLYTSTAPWTTDLSLSGKVVVVDEAHNMLQYPCTKQTKTITMRDLRLEKLAVSS